MSFTGQDEGPHAFVLCAPWALFDVSRDVMGIGRRLLSMQSDVLIPAGMPIFVAAPAGRRVDVDGPRLGAQLESRGFFFGHHRYELHSLSIGTRDEDAEMTVLIDNEAAGQIKIDEHLPRPSWSLGHESRAPTHERQEQLDLYLLGLVDLIRLADDPAVAWYESGWARLANAWARGKLDLSEPPMALIVRHASTLQRLLNDLRRHPRHILSRTRQMTPVDRVQQLDIASVRWLSRQPGEDVYERAGARQRILAVRRFEDLDTLENRVVRDLAQRSRDLADTYTRQYKRLELSQRWQQVDKYKRECQRLTLRFKESEIGLPRPPVVPNYALTQDRRYRRAWRAYREILRRIDEQDECWRWQHRLWADFCRLLVQVVLHVETEFGIIAESPLRISPEQQRGRWSLVDAQSGVYLIHDREQQPIAVLSVLWDTTADHPKLSPWMASLGAVAVLHLQNLADAKESFLLLWPLHLFGETTADKKQIAESGHRALQSCLKKIELEENLDIRAEALVLLSNFDAEREATRTTYEKVGSVGVTRFGAGYGDMKELVEDVGRVMRSTFQNLLEDQRATY